MAAGAIGIDFGTTNSSIARINHAGEVELASFPFNAGLTDSYRSLLYLEQTKTTGPRKLLSWSGPEGIEHYLAADVKGRLIQSLKSFLSSRTLESTDVFGKRYTIEDLIARILKDLREKAQQQFDGEIRSAVVGRPIRFVGADKPEDDDTRRAVWRKLFSLPASSPFNSRWSRWPRRTTMNRRLTMTN